MLGCKRRHLGGWFAGTLALLAAVAIAAVAAISGSVSTSSAKAATDSSSWQLPAAPYRMDLQVSDPSISSILDGFPVKVVLTGGSSGNFNYAAASPDGTAADASSADLAFILSGDSTDTQLPYYVDTWNPGGTSVVWVLLPTLTSSSQDLELYYGDSGVAGGTYNGPVGGTAFWGSGGAGLSHEFLFNQSELDYSANNVTPATPLDPLSAAPLSSPAAAVGSGDPGLPTGAVVDDLISPDGATTGATMQNDGLTSGSYGSQEILGNAGSSNAGQALELSGITCPTSTSPCTTTTQYGGQYLTIPGADGEASAAGGLTESATIYVPASAIGTTDSDYVLGQAAGWPSSSYYGNFVLVTAGTQVILYPHYGNSSSAELTMKSPSGTLSAGWNTVTATVDNEAVDLYVNGKSVATGTMSSPTDLTTAVPGGSLFAPIFLGAHPVEAGSNPDGAAVGSSNPAFAQGYGDVSFAQTAESGDWVHAEYESQINNLISYGQLQGQDIPSGVTVAGSTAGTDVTVSWSSVSAASGYDIYEGTTSGGEGATPVAQVSGASTTSDDFTIPSPVNGQTYYFTVAAVVDGSPQLSSTEVSYKLQDPYTPSGVTVSGSGPDVTVSWSSVSAASGYDIYEGTTPGGEGATPVAQVSGASTTSDDFTIPSPADNQTYYFTVAAVVDGSSQLSSGEASYTLKYAPTGVTVTGSGADVTISWNQVSGVSGYDVYESDAAGGEGSTPVAEVSGASATSAQYTIPSPAAGHTYYFTVAAVVNGSAQTPSREISYLQLSPPSGLTATAYTDGSTIELSWDGEGAQSYTVYQGNAQGQESSTPAQCIQLSATSCIVVNLVAGQTYWFTVVANSPADTSAASEASVSTLATNTEGDEWQLPGAPYRLPLKATDTNIMTTSLPNFPTKVVLTPQSFDYAGDSSDGVAADATPTDLAFVQAADPNGTQLPYQVDTWNPGGTSVLYVDLPVLPWNGTEAVELYYGPTPEGGTLDGPGTSYAGPNAAATWANGFSVVNQFTAVGNSTTGTPGFNFPSGDAPALSADGLPSAPQSPSGDPSAKGSGIPTGTTFPDVINTTDPSAVTPSVATMFNNGATSGDYESNAIQGPAGGQGVQLSGTTAGNGGQYIELPGSDFDASASRQETVTYDVYVPSNVPSLNNAVPMAQAPGTPSGTGANMWFGLYAGSLTTWIYPNITTSTGEWNVNSSQAVKPGAWNQIALVSNGPYVTIYVNGAEGGTIGIGGDVGMTPNATAPIYLGERPGPQINSLEPATAFGYDDLTVSQVARNADWIQAQYQAEMNGVFTYGNSASPTTPLAVTANGSGQDGKVAVSWQSPPTTSGVTGYEVFEGTSPGQEGATPVATVNGVDTTSAQVTGAPAGHSYYTVEATTGSGASAGTSLPSDETEYTWIAPPSDVTATDDSDTSVELSWGQSPAASSYQAYEGTKPGGESSTAVACKALTSTSCVVSGLDYDKAYYFEVTAESGSGTESVSSPEVAGTPGLNTPWEVSSARERLPIVLNDLGVASGESDQAVEVKLPASFDYQNASQDNLDFTLGAGPASLPYQVTDWDDASDGTSTIWVQVPTLSADSPSVYMYYDGAPAQKQDASVAQSGPQATVGSTEYRFTTSGARIDGTPQVGDTLKADTSGFSPTDADAYAYEWRDGGKPITLPDGSEADGPQLALTPALIDSGAVGIGDQITLEIDGEQGDVSLSAVSAPVTVTKGQFDPGTPAISGTAKVGGTLNADPGTWSPSGTVSYQWLRNGQPIAGATSSSYAVQAGDFGSQISVAVTESSDDYADDTADSAPHAIGLGTPEIGIPSVAGAVQVGRTVTAQPGDGGSSGATPSYQWLLGGRPIGGATGSSYAITGADAGQLLSVQVSEQQPGFSLGTASSAGYEVQPGQFSGGTAKITGRHAVGGILKASARGWSPAPETVGYQWRRGGKPIAGATSSTYNVAVADSGRQISVTVNAGATGMQTASATSGAVTITKSATRSNRAPMAAAESTGKRVTLKPGIRTTTIKEVVKNLKAGTKLAVKVQMPGASKAKDASVTVKRTNRKGYTEYAYKTGRLPVGTTTVRFYERVGKTLKLVRTETIHVRRRPA